MDNLGTAAPKPGHSLSDEQKSKVYRYVAIQMYNEENSDEPMTPELLESMRQFFTDSWYEYEPDGPAPTEDGFSEYIGGCWMGQSAWREYNERVTKALELADQVVEMLK